MGVQTTPNRERGLKVLHTQAKPTAKLVNKAVLKMGMNESIQHPVGTLDRQVTAQMLKSSPEKYLRLFPNSYSNKESLLHELNTRSEVVSRFGGKSMIKSQKASNGISYNVLTGLPQKKK